MTRLPEPVHSTVPLLDPARDATPPAHLRATLLAVREEAPDADGAAASRPSRRRPAVALAAACLAMVAAAGLVAQLRPAPPAPTTAVRPTGAETRTSSSASAPGVVPERPDLRFGPVPERCPGVTGNVVYDYAAGAGEPSPQTVVDELEKGWVARELGRRAVFKVVERSADQWRLVYLDAAGHYVGGAKVTEIGPGRWVLESTAACEPG